MVNNGNTGKEEIGTVISTFEGPSPSGFSFVIKGENRSEVPVRKDQFVSVGCEDGELIARVTNVRKTNRYYSRAESVKDYESQTELGNLFPVDSWEFLVADALPLGVFKRNSTLGRSTFPVSPGEKVRLVEPETLSKFLGFDDGGLELGKVEHHDLTVRINLTRLLQKHLAIMAQSGSGKSHLSSILMEELVDRPRDMGRIGIVVIDIHGEYTSFAEDDNYKDRVEVIEGNQVKIPVSDLSAYELSEFIPKISSAQRRDLNRIVGRLWEERKGNYDFQAIIAEIENSGIRDATKQALESWIADLEATGLFSSVAYPSIKNLVKPGMASVIDLSNVSGLRNKQIIVTYLSRKLFAMRKKNQVPPYVEIIEEAHNFVPEGTRQEAAIARHILETIAREGRKFYASLCLISQRPVHLSTTVLSQCNTNIILRVTNPYDLEHIGQSCEGITNETLQSITSLQVGEALVIGEAVNHPVFLKVRDRKSIPSRHSLKLEEAAKKFETSRGKEEEDAKAFL